MRTTRANVVLNNAILGDGGGGGVGIPGDVAADYFAALGATQPWYAGSTQYNACHYNGKTYVAWESYDATSDKRHTQIRAYTHSSGLWGRVYTVGPASNVEDDDHGVPAIAVNADGRIIVVWGNHDGDFHIATSTVAEDESRWTVISNGVAGRYTYPHLVLIGTTMYCLLRLDTIPATEFTNGAKYLVYRPITWSGATATVGAQVKIADFGDDSRWYQGNMFLIAGDRIAQVAARADYNDTFRRDVYYYEIDITNARLQQFDGGTDAFPVSRANMDANYRVRTTTAPAVLGVPALLIEGSNTHIVFAEGETDPTVYHIIGAAGSFAAPVSVFVNTGASTLADSPRLIAEASGFSMYYPTDAVAAYTRGGDVSRRLWDGDSWGSEELVLANDNLRWPLGQIGFVFNPHANGRVIFTEIAETDADSAGFPQKRAFLFGDSGFLPHVRPSGTAPSISGEGAWYDPSDLSTLWSDTARTTPAVVDGPVQAIDDKSGNGHHILLEGGLEAGTLRTDDGIYWIDMGDEFSPTTSYAVSTVSLVASDAYWVTSGHRDYNLAASSHNLINLDEGSGSDRVFSIARANAGSQGNGQINWVPFSNTGTGASFSSTADGVRGNDDFVQGLHVNGTAATAYLNGVEAGTNTVATVPDTGASRLRIGANATLTANTYTIGRFYGAIVRSGNIDLTTRQADMTYLQSKMPL